MIAETEFGRVRGIEHRGIKVFRGIPYAASTEGANRFMPPVDPGPWAGVRDAVEYGFSCPQTDPCPVAVADEEGPSIYKALAIPGEVPPPEGEDCLVLNVWTPGLEDGVKRPVLVWLHGGGFNGGSGSSRAVDGTNLAIRGDVVVVTINHRLNVFGFANLSEFGEDFAASGINGMLDIVHALKWIRTNITRFGGDPGNVTIIGQSGGGRKVETLLAMPAAKGLFHRAVAQSGVAVRLVERETAVRNAERLLARLEIPTADVHRIQEVPAERLTTAFWEVIRELGMVDMHTVGFVPTVDAPYLPQHPFHPTASPVSADVPLLIGHTSTEVTGLVTEAALWRLDEDGLQARIGGMLGDRSREMIELYRRHHPAATPSDLYFEIASDYRYGAKTMKIAERRAALGRGSVYLYYFKWETPVQGGLLRSPHNMEIPFAFDNVEFSANLTGGGPEARDLADRISDTWLAFARTGNPNNPKIPHWPAFNAENRPTMVINDVCEVVNDPLREQRRAMFRALDFE